MGYIRHHAIVVTSWNVELLETARAMAAQIGCVVTKIIGSQTNGLGSFLVGPDGSKEDWNESDVGDFRRGVFIRWMASKCHKDGSSSLSWAEIQYGDDDHDDRILRTSHKPFYRDEPADVKLGEEFYEEETDTVFRREEAGWSVVGRHSAT